MRLSQEVIALLRLLDAKRPIDPVVLAEAPKLVFEFNLVSRLGSGDLQLTKTGARALFQAQCIEALEQAASGGHPVMHSDVERWLSSSGFLHASDRSITSRGKLWLASLEPAAEDGVGTPASGAASTAATGAAANSAACAASSANTAATTTATTSAVAAVDASTNARPTNDGAHISSHIDDKIDSKPGSNDVDSSADQPARSAGARRSA